MEVAISTVSETVDRIEAILTALADGDSDDREEASENVVDWLSTITRDEAARLGPELAKAAAEERTPSAKEAELYALAELAGQGLLTRDDLHPLIAVGRPAPGTSGREHLEYLDDEYSLWPR